MTAGVTPKSAKDAKEDDGDVLQISASFALFAVTFLVSSHSNFQNKRTLGTQARSAATTVAPCERSERGDPQKECLDMARAIRASCERRRKNSLHEL